MDDVRSGPDRVRRLVLGGAMATALILLSGVTAFDFFHGAVVDALLSLLTLGLAGAGLLSRRRGKHRLGQLLFGLAFVVLGLSRFVAAPADSLQVRVLVPALLCVAGIVLVIDSSRETA